MVGTVSFGDDRSRVNTPSIGIVYRLVKNRINARLYKSALAHHLVNGWARELLKGHHRAHWIAGETEVRYFPTLAGPQYTERQRFGWTHSYRPEVNLTVASQDILDHIVVALRDASRRYEHVGIETLSQLGIHGVQVVAGDSEQLRDAAVAEYAGGDGVAVGIVNLAL